MLQSRFSKKIASYLVAFIFSVMVVDLLSVAFYYFGLSSFISFIIISMLLTFFCLKNKSIRLFFLVLLALSFFNQIWSSVFYHKDLVVLNETLSVLNRSYKEQGESVFCGGGGCDVDPFDSSGERLKTYKIMNGMIIYSVGPDGIDDGGVSRFDFTSGFFTSLAPRLLSYKIFTPVYNKYLFSGDIVVNIPTTK
ncbi:hypothetical protein DU002_04545 [Corallincola holothuriorum]|uniref:Uncharacterized protein n=1 Tax=Corallincola holothuriorum TaxID=2282215 RepID=A0A368NPY8_9GAMM|nr:hypothetical protein DU002_04545 [Corallincola holothuriorum]